MVRDDWKADARELRALVGDEEAIAILISKRASPSTAEKIVKARYTHEPRRFVREAISEALTEARERTAS